jgi:hypothetical protein
MGHGDLFLKSRITKIIQSSLNAPWALNRGVEQAERSTVIKESVLWGCPWLNFKANLPFDGIMQFFAALLKEIPTALFGLFSNSKLLLNNRFYVIWISLFDIVLRLVRP